MNTNNAKCQLPPKDWSCTREPGHDGPCAAIPISDWEYYREEMPGGAGITIFFHTVREAGGKNIARFHDEGIARRIAELPQLERELIVKDAEIARLRTSLQDLIREFQIPNEAFRNAALVKAKEALSQPHPEPKETPKRTGMRFLSVDELEKYSRSQPTTKQEG